MLVQFCNVKFIRDVKDNATALRMQNVADFQCSYYRAKLKQTILLLHSFRCTKVA